ncbi:unnamed protein product [Gulo gulo]|uniref:Uncharacterized protein n=1 Tax=Gulo gulo TaxID=48420 RepID=A0A9X9PWX6_GULGU|nr:unnamed protein product [Gulo gulo]
MSSIRCGPKGLPATVGAGSSWSPETEACRGAEHPPTGSTSLKPSLLCPQPPPPTLELTWHVSLPLCTMGMIMAIKPACQDCVSNRLTGVKTLPQSPALSRYG